MALKLTNFRPSVIEIESPTCEQTPPSVCHVHEQVREEGCIATTLGRKYYPPGSVFVKRSLRLNEFRTGYRSLHVPHRGKVRLMSEDESVQFIQQHTDIPVPTMCCHFEDVGSYHLITEYIRGGSMSKLPEGQKAVVREELESQREAQDIEDPLKMRVIIDWEHVGFFPPRFDYPFYKQKNVALRQPSTVKSMTRSICLGFSIPKKASVARLRWTPNVKSVDRDRRPLLM
ncbi:Uncharacterized protein TCAP_04880 [Tolypocladium capitatum]|uniref:Aminoglycoside phosphotransferase domain-containing protein n=1 Tax=Tolypocladium capitatum TaxID=45235 RepID=A0A2K3QCA9_9HYPO|nr:Uncharacterized protein TCAP_04880 [Tolypocladium capitatum]